MEKVISGIRPTGNLHLGNYFGAVKSFCENARGVQLYVLHRRLAFTHDSPYA